MSFIDISSFLKEKECSFLLFFLSEHKISYLSAGFFIRMQRMSDAYENVFSMGFPLFIIRENEGRIGKIEHLFGQMYDCRFGDIPLFCTQERKNSLWKKRRY